MPRLIAESLTPWSTRSFKGPWWMERGTGNGERGTGKLPTNYGACEAYHQGHAFISGAPWAGTRTPTQLLLNARVLKVKGCPGCSLLVSHVGPSWPCRTAPITLDRFHADRSRGAPESAPATNKSRAASTSRRVYVFTYLKSRCHAVLDQ